MSTTMVENYRPAQKYGDLLPHRKPLPQSAASNVARAAAAVPLPSLDHQTQGLQRQSSHSRTRTSSSTLLPVTSVTTTSQTSYILTNAAGNQTRRTLSNATTSTNASNSSSTNHHATGMLSNLQRSGSARSGSTTSNAPLSYVALLRKQKATVWCDRAQNEDAVALASQRAARKRAALEFAGSTAHLSATPASGTSSHNRTSTAGSGSAIGAASMRSKIRHHGVPRATPYQPANLAGTGVPMRLSATEVDDDEAVDDDDGRGGPHPSFFLHHRRTASGRSSLGSGGLRASYGGVNAVGTTHSASSSLGGGATGLVGGVRPNSYRASSSAGTTPPSQEEDEIDEIEPQQYQQYQRQHQQSLSPTDEGHALEEETPVPLHGVHARDYFGSSADNKIERRQSEELKRRGSVDDRTMTISGGVRLFVANPDLDD